MRALYWGDWSMVSRGGSKLHRWTYRFGFGGWRRDVDGCAAKQLFETVVCVSLSFQALP